MPTAPVATSITAHRVGGQLDEAIITQAGYEYADLIVTATLVGDGGEPVIDPTNTATVLDGPYKTVIGGTARTDTTEGAADGETTLAGRYWWTDKLKATVAADPDNALQPTGLSWTISLQAQGRRGLVELRSWSVTLDADRDYVTEGETIAVDTSAHEGGAVDEEVVNIAYLLPPPTTVPVSDAFVNGVEDAMASIPDGAIPFAKLEAASRPKHRTYPHLIDADDGKSDAIQADYDAGWIAAGDTIQTAAYYEGSSVGGGNAYKLVVGTTSDNGGRRIQFTGFYLLAVLSLEVEAAAYGASPSRTDNQNPINQALRVDNAPVLRMPDGVLSCDGAIIMGNRTRIVGVEEDRSTIEFTQPGVFVGFHCGSTPGAQFCSLENLTIKGTYTAGAGPATGYYGDLARFDDVAHVRLQNVKVANGEGYGVLINGAERVEIDGLELDTLGRDGLHVTSSTTYTPKNVRIKNVTGSQVGDDVIAVHSAQAPRLNTTVTAAAGDITVAGVNAGEWVYIRGAGTDGGDFAAKVDENGNLTNAIATAVTSAVMLVTTTTIENIVIDGADIDHYPVGGPRTGVEKAAGIALSGVAHARVKNAHVKNGGNYAMSVQTKPAEYNWPSYDVVIDNSSVDGVGLFAGGYGANPPFCGIRVYLSIGVVIGSGVRVDNCPRSAGILVVGSTDVEIAAHISNCGLIDGIYSDIHGGGVNVMHGALYDAFVLGATEGLTQLSKAIKFTGSARSCEPSGFMAKDAEVTLDGAVVRDNGKRSTNAAAFRAGVYLERCPEARIVNVDGRNNHVGFSTQDAMDRLVEQNCDWSSSAIQARTFNGTITDYQTANTLI